MESMTQTVYVCPMLPEILWDRPRTCRARPLPNAQ